MSFPRFCDRLVANFAREFTEIDHTYRVVTTEERRKKKEERRRRGLLLPFQLTQFLEGVIPQDQYCFQDSLQFV